MALERVVHPLQVQVGHRRDPLRDGRPEVAERGQEPQSRVGVADEHVAGAHERAAAQRRRDERRVRLADPGRERRRARRGRAELAPALQHRRGVLRREVQLDHERLGPDRMQPELEAGHDAEVAAAALEAPVQLLVLPGVGADVLALGGDDLERGHVVARQPVLAGQPAHPAAEGQPADAGVGDVARGRGEPVRLGGAVERAQQRAAGDPRAARGGVDADLAERGEVEHQAVLGHREPEDPVTAAADAQLELRRAPGADRGGDVGRARAAGDRARAVVDHRVPHRAGGVVARVARFEQLAVERPGQRAQAHSSRS